MMASWKAAELQALMGDEKYDQIPPIEVEPFEGDEHLVTSGEEQVFAAQQLGMTHLPVFIRSS